MRRGWAGPPGCGNTGDGDADVVGVTERRDLHAAPAGRDQFLEVASVAGVDSHEVSRGATRGAEADRERPALPSDLQSVDTSRSGWARRRVARDHLPGPWLPVDADQRDDRTPVTDG